MPEPERILSFAILAAASFLLVPHATAQSGTGATDFSPSTHSQDSRASARQPAAEAARCANEQGKFWEYHDLLFSSSGKLDCSALLAQAKALQLNEAQFLSCLHSEQFKASVDADVKAGYRARVSGTPAFFINGVFVGGAQPASVFEKTINSELTRLSARSSHPDAGCD